VDAALLPLRRRLQDFIDAQNAVEVENTRLETEVEVR
jgi:hypothetical protein